MSTTVERVKTQPAGLILVKVVDLDIAFGSMIWLMIKFVIASIPAMIVLMVIMVIITLVLTTLFGGAFALPWLLRS